MPELDKPKQYPISYPFSAFPLGVVDVPSLVTELADASLSSQPTRVVGAPLPTVLLLFASPVSEADKSKVDSVVAAHQAGTTALQIAKKEKLVTIKRKTASLVTAGAFEYPAASGKLFGMSEVSQLNITGVFNNRTAPGFAYPVVFFTKSDLDSVSLADAAAVEEFHAAAVAAIRAIRDGGAALKAQVVAATTVEAVRAIVDNR